MYKRSLGHLVPESKKMPGGKARGGGVSAGHRSQRERGQRPTQGNLSSTINNDIIGLLPKELRKRSRSPYTDLNKWEGRVEPSL